MISNRPRSLYRLSSQVTHLKMALLLAGIFCASSMVAAVHADDQPEEEQPSERGPREFFYQRFEGGNAIPQYRNFAELREEMERRHQEMQRRMRKLPDGTEPQEPDEGVDNSRGKRPGVIEPQEFRAFSQIQQIRHLRMAAENLDAAGFKEEAEKLKQRAEEIEARLKDRGGAPANTAVLEEVRALRRSVEELKEEVRALRRQLGEDRPRPPHPPFGRGPHAPGRMGPPKPEQPQEKARDVEREKPREDEQEKSREKENKKDGNKKSGLLIPSLKLDEPVSRLGDPVSIFLEPEPTPVREAARIVENELEFELVPIPDNVSPIVPQPYVQEKSKR